MLSTEKHIDFTFCKNRNVSNLRSALRHTALARCNEELAFPPDFKTNEAEMHEVDLKLRKSFFQRL